MKDRAIKTYGRQSCLEKNIWKPCKKYIFRSEVCPQFRSLLFQLHRIFHRVCSMFALMACDLFGTGPIIPSVSHFRLHHARPWTLKPLGPLSGSSSSSSSSRDSAKAAASAAAVTASQYVDPTALPLHGTEARRTSSAKCLLPAEDHYTATTREGALRPILHECRLIMRTLTDESAWRKIWSAWEVSRMPQS